MQIDQIGQGIADRRKQLGLSQEELAKKLGVTRQAVSRWESGTALPSVDNMIELSRALEISVDELLQLAPQQKESDLSIQSIGLLMDEQNARQEKRIRRLTIALAAGAMLLVAGIVISTVAGLIRSSRMEEQLNDRISGISQTVSASIGSMDARISQTVQQAISDGNTRLADSSTRTAYEHESRSFVVTLNAQVQELGDYADAEFYLLSGNGDQRFSAPAEMTDSGFSGRLHIPDEGQEFISGRAYLSWREDGEAITEKIPFYMLQTYPMRPVISWIHLNHQLVPGQDIQICPFATICFSYEYPDTYPVSIRYDILRDGERLWTFTEQLSIRRGDAEPAYFDHGFHDYFPLEGVTSVDGLVLRVTVTDAQGREFTKEYIPD